MTALEELAILRPRVSELEHALATERRHNRNLIDRLTHSEKENTDLRNMIIALREAHNRDKTPPMGTRAVETDPVIRKNREHG